MNKLIFVYNANSGIGNLVLDVAHKLFSPKTYACNLCAITFNTFSENKTWKTFRAQSTIDFEFLHIDEFKKKHQNLKFDYPVILNESIEVFLDKEAINALHNVEDLISIIKTKHGKARVSD